MKARLYFTAEGNSEPSYLRELTIAGVDPGAAPQYVYTGEKNGLILFGTTNNPPTEGVKSHPTEKFYKHNKKLSLDNECNCYLEIRY